MRLHLALSLLAAGLIGRCSAASNSTSGRSFPGWKPCSAFTFSGKGEYEAECVTYKAPLCHSGICKVPVNVKRTIEVFVKRLRAKGDEADDAANVWLITGDHSTTVEQSMVTLHKSLKGAVNVYTMDLRGSGRSTRLHCDPDQQTTLQSQPEVNKEEVDISVCAQKLQNKYGDLASFSTTSAAMDISAFISEHTNDVSTIVYGVGAGTAIAQLLMQLKPPSVNGYVLDRAVAYSVAPDKKTYATEYDVDFSDVGERFMKLCAHDVDCASHFRATSMSATLHKVLRRFEGNSTSSCAKMIAYVSEEDPSTSLRFTLGYFMSNVTTRSMIAPLVYRLNRCNHNDLSALANVFLNMARRETVPDEAGDFNSTMCGLMTMFSEVWPTPTPSYSDLQTRFKTLSMCDTSTDWMVSTYCQFSKERSPACVEAGIGKYKAHPITYAHDQYWDQPATVPSHASVLMMHGRLDPAYHFKHAKSLFGTLDTSKKELVAFDYAQGATIETTPFGNDGKNCGMELLLSYVSSNANLKRLDKSCVGKMPAFNMKVAPELAKSYFGTVDMYDGVPTPVEQNGKVKAAF